MGLDAPKFDESTNTITLPDNEGVEYLVSGKPVKGELEIKRATTVRVRAERGFVLDKSVEREHRFVPSKLEKLEEKSEEKPADENKKPADPVLVTDPGNTPQNPAQGSRVAPSVNNPR